MAATRRLWGGLAVCAMALGLGAPGPSAADQNGDRCAAHIRGALYPARVGDEGSAEFPAFAAWLCTRDFTTHEQALREGLALGTEVYGIPLETGGRFGAGERSAWKRARASCLRGTANAR